MNMPPSTEVFFLIDGNPVEYWGSIQPALLPDADVGDLNLDQVSFELLELQESLLQQQDPNVQIDENLGVIYVRLLQPTAFGATVTMDPPPPPGTSFGIDMDNNLVLDGNMIDTPLLPFWVAFNLEPDDVGGAVSITVDHPERECTVVHPVFPTRAGYTTLVDVDCPPP
jgi:hypothetical protein